MISLVIWHRISFNYHSNTQWNLGKWSKMTPRGTQWFTNGSKIRNHLLHENDYTFVNAAQTLHASRQYTYYNWLVNNHSKWLKLVTNGYNWLWTTFKVLQDQKFSNKKEANLALGYLINNLKILTLLLYVSNSSTNKMSLTLSLMGGGQICPPIR